MTSNDKNREEELKAALLLAQEDLQKRTREATKYKNQLKSIKEAKMFLPYLAVRKTLLLPKKGLHYSKRGAHKVAKQLLKTDKSRRLAVKTAKQLQRIVGSKRAGKSSRLFVDALDATRRQQYQQWFDKHWPSESVLTGQRTESAKWTYRPLISILVPTYNTDHTFLIEAIKSVQNQSYENWELCFADDASKDAGVRKIIAEQAKADPRIKYVFREKNGHISAASNSALKIAKGEFVGLLDHDDILWPNALYENVKALNGDKNIDMLYSDEDKLSEDGRIHEDPYFKPDWSPDQLRCHNYITHFSVLRTSLVKKVGGFREGFEGAQDWDLLIRVSREAKRIYHIPTMLYSWRKAPTSTALRADAKDYAWTVQRHVLQDDITVRGLHGEVRKTNLLGLWRIKYTQPDVPLVSIVIPTKDQYQLIKQCLQSIAEFTTYPNYEIILVDTGSTDERVWKLYEAQKSPRLHVEKWTKPFNFSSVCNYGAAKAKGQYLLFLNNDTEVITAKWIEDLLGYAAQEHVGAVGCKLLYPNRHIQHAGIVLGMGGFPDTPAIAGHVFAGWDNALQDQYKIMFTEAVRDSSAVTAACVMVAKEKFDQVKGFDESFKIAFNDVDFCLKLREKGYYNVYLPYVQLYHHESVSVGRDQSNRDMEAFKNEHRRMAEKWGHELFENDPFFNKNYDLSKGYIQIKEDA